MHARLYFSELLQYDLRKIGLSKMTLKSMKVITNGDRSYIHHSLPLQNVVSNREILTVTASPSENWRRPPGRPRTTWMKTIQQDLRSNNLSLDGAITVAQNRPLWRLFCVWRYAPLVVLATQEEEEDTIYYS